MNKFAPLFICLLILCSFTKTSPAAEKNDFLFQYSTINALLQGLYDGEMSFAALETHGDIGLGTFNGLDGEMIALDGTFYQIKTDGIAYIVQPDAQTPFAVVTFFDNDSENVLPHGLDYAGLKNHILSLITNRNHFQAIRIEGLFAKVTTRSVPAQTPPYKPLAKVVEQQSVFHFDHTEGTLVGFYTPDYVSGLNVPGFHFHFLTKDRRGGGHVLDLDTAKGTIRIDEIKEFMMDLPDSKDFAETDLSGAKKHQLNKVEHSH